MEYEQQAAIAETQPAYLNRCLEKQRQFKIRPVDADAEIVDSDGDEQERCGFGDHLPRIPGKRNQPPQRPQVHQRQKQLTGQHPAQICPDPKAGNAKEDKADAEQQGGGILNEGGACSAKAV